MGGIDGVSTPCVCGRIGGEMSGNRRVSEGSIGLRSLGNCQPVRIPIAVATTSAASAEVIQVKCPCCCQTTR